MVSEEPIAHHEPQQQQTVVAQNETIVKYKPIEGYLAICGGCSVMISII